MAQHQPTPASPPEKCAPAPACDPKSAASGPPREAGGTTGDGNLSPQQSNRTGGATGGVGTDADKPSRSGTIPPDA